MESVRKAGFGCAHCWEHFILCGRNRLCYDGKIYGCEVQKYTTVCPGGLREHRDATFKQNREYVESHELNKQFLRYIISSLPEEAAQAKPGFAEALRNLEKKPLVTFKALPFLVERWPRRKESDEHFIGAKKGLSIKMDLAAECAKFYLLEDLTRRFYPPSRRENMRYPMAEEFGRHSMMDAVGSAVLKDFQDTVKRLSKQFGIYLTLACGGELRHYHSQTYVDDEASGCYHDCFDSDHPWNECEHECDGYCEDGPYADRLTEGDPSGVETRVTKATQEFLRTYGEGVSGRSEAWADWWSICNTRQRRVKRLNDAAILFNEGQWGRGYGGDKWGTGAEIARDYYAGKISPITFVDRVWTLTHHGGPMLNKFYYFDTSHRSFPLPEPMPDGRTSSPDVLEHVLSAQASNDYESLWAVAPEKLYDAYHWLTKKQTYKGVMYG